MSPHARGFSVGSVLLLAGLLGCQTTARSSDHFAANGTKGTVTVVGDPSVVLDLPAVDINHDTIFITGTVHRKAGIPGDLPGRVDIEFLTAEGQYLDGLPALLTPRAIPFDPGESARYSTSYGFVPPVGSIVRVHFVDRETQIKEDLQGTDFSYGGSNGAHGGYAAGAAGGFTGGKPANHAANRNSGHSSNNNHGGLDSGFGNNNFGGTHW
jgi:hypothetical protein